jgi:nucleotidyltransferase/DNA polymerase involved in DNA repair
MPSSATNLTCSSEAFRASPHGAQGPKIDGDEKGRAQASGFLSPICRTNSASPGHTITGSRAGSTRGRFAPIGFESRSAENTFSADLFAFDAAYDALQPIVDKVWRCCESAGTRGRTVTLKVKYADFQQITRSQTGAAPLANRAELERQSFELLEHLFPVPKGVRLLGVSMSSLDVEQTSPKPQLSLAL